MPPTEKGTARTFDETDPLNVLQERPKSNINMVNSIIEVPQGGSLLLPETLIDGKEKPKRLVSALPRTSLDKTKESSIDIHQQ